MTRMFVVLLTFLITVPSDLFAKSETCKITIKGGDLKGPIEITDPNILASFNVWSGAGTSSTISGVTTQEDRGFIIDWPRGIVTDRPKGLTRYQVSFYAKLSDERLVYVVFYEYDPAKDQGYVYVPGKTDEWYRLNVGTIFRGVEGNWFFARDAWERIAKPLITTKGTAVSKSRLERSPGAPKYLSGNPLIAGLRRCPAFSDWRNIAMHLIPAKGF